MDSFATQTAAKTLATGWPEVAEACSQIELVAAGLSDSVLFRIDTPHGRFRLQVPLAGLSRHADTATRGLLDTANNAAIPFVPKIIEPRAPVPGWWLFTWLPGQVIAHSDWRDEHTHAAAKALATLHRAIPLQTSAHSPAIHKRLERLAARHNYVPRQFDRIADKLGAEWKAPDAGEFECALELAKQAIHRVTKQRVAQHYCWGDAWRGNMLFADNSLGGFIDFDTACVDTPMLDLARFAGSLPDGRQRRFAVECYDEACGLSELERLVARALDLSGVVISFANWSRWCDEGHPSVDRPAAAERITHLTSRLRQLAASGDRDFL